MTSPNVPDEEELAVKERLIELVDGPAAAPSPSEDPAAEPRAWWSHAQPPQEKPVAKEPDAPEEATDERPDRQRAFEPQPDYWPRPHMPAVVHRQRERAADAISPGTRRLLYNASAAGAGWVLGLYQQFAGALVDCGTNYSISGALVLGAGGIALIAHVWDRRTRHWWPGIAWVARIPLATAVLALALWAPASAA